MVIDFYNNAREVPENKWKAFARKWNKMKADGEKVFFKFPELLKKYNGVYNMNITLKSTKNLNKKYPDQLHQPPTVNAPVPRLPSTAAPDISYQEQNQAQQGPPRVARKIPLLLPQTPSVTTLASTQPFSQEALQTAQYLLQQFINNNNNNSNNSNTEHGDAAEESTNIAEKRPAIFHHGNNNEDRSHKRQKQKRVSPRW